LLVVGLAKHSPAEPEGRSVQGEAKGIAAPKVIKADAQLEHYTAQLLELERREYLSPAEKELAELLTILIEKYEDEHYPIPSAPANDVLRELLAANHLKQKDIAPIFGSAGVVSEVLSGKRDLTTRHIKERSERFHVSAAIFFQQ
jgi:HTH-type transcriptional regulator/antitoxin HigA